MRTLAAYYYILSLINTTAVMGAEAYLKDKLSISIVPTPGEISKGCGLAIRFMDTDLPAILSVLETSPLVYTLYKLGTQKIDGARSLEVIAQKQS